nr:xylulose kinase-1 [Tanacetum cinerariifolium]
MKIEHYLSHTDYPIWQVRQNGNGHVSVTTDTNEIIKVLPSKTIEEVVARERDIKARTTLLMALPEDHLEKFHKMADAKEMWEAIKSRFCGNDESKKMQKYLLKQQFKGFSVSASEALDTIDGEDIDWSRHVEEDTQNYAMMAYSSSNSGSDNEVKSYSNTFEESYARLKKLYDEQRDKLSDASVEFTAYTLALKKVEAQLLCHQQNQLAYEQKIRLLNTQMGANDKFGLGYGDYRYGSILSYENGVLQSVFMNKECDLEDTPVNDRYAEGMHAVPPPMIGNYIPSRPDVEIDYSKFTYGPKQTLADESDSKPVEYASSDSDSSIETTTSMPTLVDNAPKIVCKPKVWTDAPIIEEYELDSDDDSAFNVQENIEKPSFAFIDYVKHIKSPRENIKETDTPNHIPKIKKQDRYSHTKTGLGYTRKACFFLETAVKASAGCNWRSKRNPWNKVFNYNSGSKFCESVKDPLGRLKSEMAWVLKRN